MKASLMRITIVLGTRAELIKTFPIIKELLNRDHEVKFIHTGQHNLEKYIDLFDLPEPDVILSGQPEDSSKFKGSTFGAVKWSLSLLFKLRQEIKNFEPDYLLYHGDTMTTTLASIAGSRFFSPLKTYKSVHLEAGLRSGSIFEPFPEELSRKIADFFSDILFASSRVAKNNLKFYWAKDVYDVGNTVVDSANEAIKIGKKFHLNKYGVVTIHRNENIKSEERMEKIVEILKDSPRKLVFPLHDNTRKYLKEYNLLDELKDSKVKIVDLMDYPDFIKCLSQADIVYTDGGSIQEEVTYFKVPCVVLRKKSERKMANKLNYIYRTDFDVESTISKAHNLINSMTKDKSPYGRSGVSQKIVDILEEKHES